MDIEDQVIKAIQAYASELQNTDFRLNLMACAEHMAPQLIASLGLKQSWAILHIEKSLTTDADGKNPHIHEYISEISHDTQNRMQVVDELAFHEKMNGSLSTEYTREAVGTQLSTDWTEEIAPAIDPDLAFLVEHDDVEIQQQDS